VLYCEPQQLGVGDYPIGPCLCQVRVRECFFPITIRLSENHGIFKLGVTVRDRRLLACTKPQAIIENSGLCPVMPLYRRKNLRILLANSFQPSQAGVSVEDFPGPSEFKEALYEVEFTACRGSPTVSERYLRQNASADGAEDASDTPKPEGSLFGFLWALVPVRLSRPFFEAFRHDQPFK
jgi:hypothetical protein